MKKGISGSVFGNIRLRTLGCVWILALAVLLPAAPEAAAKSTDSAFARAMAGSSIRLLQETLKLSKENENVLISPDSILTAMAVVENGTAGSTRSEMKKALGGVDVAKYSKSLAALHKRVAASKNLTYSSANSIWYKKGAIKLKKKYLQKMKETFQAEVYAEAFDAGTVKNINQWVSEKTNEKIREIIDRLEPSARLVICNAVYFKGSWQTAYTKTHKRVFTDAQGKRKKVKMLEGTESIYLTVDGAEGFMKYYQGGTLAFVALLPPKGMSVEEYLSGLTGAEWLDGYRNRMTSHVSVDTRMPEFSYEYKVSLEEPLAAMGIRKAFSNQANFSNMTKSSVCIDQVLHKTYIKVDKSGTEAAAVTAVLVKNTTAVNPVIPLHKTVYLNRPFVYAIVDVKTGLPMFIGTVKKI